jgi:hypothetical protein
VRFALGRQNIDMKQFLCNEIGQLEFSGNREGSALLKPTIIARICS